MAISLLNYGIYLENLRTSRFPQIISLCRESLALGQQEAISLLRQTLYNHGHNYLAGRNGIEQDLHKALELYRESAALGFPQAFEQLEKLQGFA